eukprot:2371582-Rhodomonas_salina.3
MENKEQYGLVYFDSQALHSAEEHMSMPLKMHHPHRVSSQPQMRLVSAVTVALEDCTSQASGERLWAMARISSISLDHFKLVAVCWGVFHQGVTSLLFPCGLHSGESWGALPTSLTGGEGRHT